MSNKYLSKPSTFIGRLKERMANVFGYIGPAETIDKKIENLDNSISMNDDSGFSLIVQSKIYGDIINKYELILDDIKDKLLNGGNFTGKQKQYQLQILKHQSMILLSKTSDQIVKAKTEFNCVLENICQDYFNSILNGDFSDIYVLNLVEDINSILQNCSNLTFPFVVIKGFNDLKSVYEYSEKNKCVIDRIIEKNQTRIELIKADPKTINAYASRDAIIRKKR